MTTNITTKYMTKYEKTRILGLRATQISNGAKVNIDTNGETDPLRIALMEFNQHKIPFLIRRTLPSGKHEDVNINDLIS
jgi:DNA-directed RNA polymerase I, II, and III subunit RPABC2